MEEEPQKIIEEDCGPSIDSDNVDERIAARRLRIERRLEALKREQSDGEHNIKSTSAPDKEASKSRKQIEQSYQRLTKLTLDGSELVSNVEVACDAREAALRREEDESRRLRKAKLEEEVKIATEKFDEITKRWEMAVKKDIPQELKQILKAQQEKCDHMIEEKNKLINDLQQDLKQKDDQYVKDLRKQAEDVDLMIERMEEQMKSLKKAYEEELDNIENSLYSERKDVLLQQKTKCTNQSEQRKNKELEYSDMRQKRVDTFEDQLQTLRVQDAEEYNMVRIKLETDVQILEQNLQQMKATYQLNQEKLEYNFQVLKKRDEENTITKSQQKRKITRLQDLLNNLKTKLKNQERGFGDDNQSLSDDLKRITEQYKELQKKFRHFQATDHKKFGDIWKMNEEQIKDLVSDVLAEDRIIFEQQLGLEWQPPNLGFLKNVGPLQSLKGTSKSAMDAVHEILSATSPPKPNPPNAISPPKPTNPTPVNDDVIKEDGSMEIISKIDTIADYKLSAHAIKHMLELLCDESGFLVESKLIKLLAPIDKDEQSLMKLDAIFNAIGVETESDIMNLSKYLYKSRRIPIITQQPSEDSTLERNESNETMVTDQPTEQIAYDLIHSNDVIKALRMFVNDNQEPIRETSKASSKLGISVLRDDTQDQAYWSQLSSVIDGKKERVWDALIEGFEKYSHVLGERATLIQDTDSLRQQNSELRMLLHQYLSSKVNNELQIPPTRVLQLELSRK